MGRDARSRGEKIERIQRKHVIYKFTSSFVHLDVHESYLKLPLHVLSLSLAHTHPHIQTFFHSLRSFFFFFFLNSREQSIRRPREKIHSKIVITYSNVQYRNNRELFNKHRQMFRCLYEFLFPFVFFVSIQRIYIGLLLSFGNVSMKAFVFLKRRFTEGVEINEEGGWKEQKETFFYVTFDLVLNLDILSDRKIHKGTRHDQTSF